MSVTTPPRRRRATTTASAEFDRDVNRLALALYVTDAHTRPALTDHEFAALVAQGTHQLGADHLAALADRLNRVETSWALGVVDDDDFTVLRRTILSGDVDRFERCYSHAIGEPHPQPRTPHPCAAQHKAGTSAPA